MFDFPEDKTERTHSSCLHRAHLVVSTRCRTAVGWDRGPGVEAPGRGGARGACGVCNPSTTPSCPEPHRFLSLTCLPCTVTWVQIAPPG